MEKTKIIGCKDLEKCFLVGCNEVAVYFRKLDKNKNPLCYNHYLQVNPSEKRHYYEKNDTPITNEFDLKFYNYHTGGK